MKQKLKDIVKAFHKYNSEHMALMAFGLDDTVEYDALVVAPSFSPFKLGLDDECNVTVLKEGAYNAGYLVEKDGMKIAWIKTGSSAGNLIDHLSICAELTFKKIIFIGAAGALKPQFDIGDICIPSYSISGSYADSYLMKETIRGSMLFEEVYSDPDFSDKVISLGRSKGYDIKKCSVFCTPSVALEYSHIDEIRAFDTDLIEMETASFLLMADLFELPAAALLVVSDNSAAGVPLIGRTPEQQIKYNFGRNTILPEMIFGTVKEL